MRLRKINLFDSIVILTIIISFVLFVLYPFIAVFNYGIKVFYQINDTIINYLLIL